MLPDLCLPEPCLVTHVYGALLPKTEIRNPVRDEDLANQNPSWIPDLNSVPTPRIHISFHVALDPVWPATIGECEEAFVRQERTGYDVERVDVARACFVDWDVFTAMNSASICDVQDFEVR